MGKHENGYARVARDFYPSPGWVTAALAEHVDLTGLRVWECACGDGRMAEALKDAGAIVYATDIEDRGYSGFDGALDFLSTMNGKPASNYIITNPPGGERNTLAEKFVEIGLHHIARGGGLLALLRFFADCRFFAGKIVLTRRIKWFEPPPGERKKSPKENHSWYVWRCPCSHAVPAIFYAPLASPPRSPRSRSPTNDRPRRNSARLLRRATQNTAHATVGRSRRTHPAKQRN